MESESNERCNLLSTVDDIDSSLTNINDSILTSIFLFGKPSLGIEDLVNPTMNYIIFTNRSEDSLFDYFVIFCYIFISLTIFCILILIHQVLRFAFIIF